MAFCHSISIRSWMLVFLFYWPINAPASTVVSFISLSRVMFSSVLEESARVYFTTIFRSTWSLFSVCSSIFFSTSTASCATSFVVSFSEDSSAVVSASVVSSVLSLSLLFLEDVSLTTTSLPSSPTTFTGSFASSDFLVLSVLSETSEAFPPIRWQLSFPQLFL